MFGKNDDSKPGQINNNIEADNSEDFQKVTIDHRSVVSYTTVRGLRKCGTTVNFETNKRSDLLHVLEMDKDNLEYKESLSVINMFNGSRNSFYNIYGSLKQNKCTNIGVNI